MTDTPSNLERLRELICDRMTGSLAHDDAAELERLLASHPGVDPDALEYAAGALVVAELGPRAEPLPAHLAERIAGAAAVPSPARRPPAREETIPFPGTGQVRGSRFSYGWLAAAAALLLAVLGWWPRLAPSPAPQPAPGLSAAERRQQLLTADPSAIVADWVMPAPETPDAACEGGCAGDIVWSNAKQEGFMRIRGLARNDPSVSQYQLWIFDSNQPEATPVDGGVFDVTQSGEVIVPIDAKLRIVDPTLFAVTVEKPGGVVQSKRERIPILAKVSA